MKVSARIDSDEPCGYRIDRCAARLYRLSWLKDDVEPEAESRQREERDACGSEKHHYTRDYIIKKVYVSGSESKIPFLSAVHTEMKQMDK